MGRVRPSGWNCLSALNLARATQSKYATCDECRARIDCWAHQRSCAPVSRSRGTRFHRRQLAVEAMARTAACRARPKFRRWGAAAMFQLLARSISFKRATFAVAIVLWASLPAFAERRVALVIGNSNYRDVPVLANPRNDAEDVAAALKRLGFDTTVGLDADRAGHGEGDRGLRHQGGGRRRGALLLRRPRHAASGRQLPACPSMPTCKTPPACDALPSSTMSLPT